MGQAECQSHLDIGLVQRAAEVLDHRLYTNMYKNQIKQPTSGHGFVFHRWELVYRASASWYSSHHNGISRATHVKPVANITERACTTMDIYYSKLVFRRT